MLESRVNTAFAPPEESLGWARDAIDEFDARAGGFFKGDVAEFVTELDPQTGENVRKVRLLRHLPRDLRRRAMESLNHAKGGCDQAISAVRNLVGPASNKSGYFPWASSPDDLERLLKSRAIDQRFWDVIKSQEPYPGSDTYAGGDEVLRTLVTIANGKHTVGLAVEGRISMMRPPNFVTNGAQQIKIRVPYWDPVKNEAETMRWTGELELEGEEYVEFQILFKDARLPMLVGASSGLKAFARKADTIVKALKARSLELGL